MRKEIWYSWKDSNIVSDVIWNRSHSFMCLLSLQTQIQSSRRLCITHQITSSTLESHNIFISIDWWLLNTLNSDPCNCRPHWALLQYFWTYMIAVADKTVYLTVLCTNLGINTTHFVFLYTMHLFHGGRMHLKKKIIFILVYRLVKSWHKEYYFQVISLENTISALFIHRPRHQYFNNS